MMQESLQKARELASSAEELQRIAQEAGQPAHYGVEELFQRPQRFAFAISPCGTYFSFRERQPDGKSHLYLQELTTGQTTCILQEGEEPIKGYGWLSPERLYYIQDQGGDENYHLYACDTDGSHALDLTPYPNCKVQIIALLRDDPKHIIIGMNKNNPQLFEPYRLNVYDGTTELLFRNEDVTAPIQDFIFDKMGRMRGFVRLENGVNSSLYYNDDLSKVGREDVYRHKITTRWDETFDLLYFNYPSSNPHEVYVCSNVGRDKSAILRYDIRSMELLEELFVHPEYDVAGLSLSRKRNYEINYWSYDADRYTLCPISETYRAIDRRFKALDPDELYYVVDYDDEEKTFLIVTQSDRNYGTYHTYRPATDEVQTLCSLKPDLQAENLSPMQHLKLKARDGVELHAYLTLPLSASKDRPVPMVVIPHGGPQGIRDTWGFDPEVQLLAQYGYASLQVNFRISGGYGKKFLRAGFKQVGRAVQSDLEDAVQYVLEHYPIAERQLAVYGGSHGGYATLMAMVRRPQLFACGVDYVGISSIETFFESFPEYWKPMRDIVKEIWYDVDDPQELAIAREVSPLLQTDRIERPILVVQGANDPRVKLSEANQMVEALRAKGLSTPYMLKENEGHGFYNENNRIEFYRTMIGFLALHLK